jgi:hypothetical protein
MIKCPFCHFDNEDGVLFCERCTSDLTVVAPPPPAVPIPPAVPMAEAVAVPLAMEASNLEAVPLATAEPIEAIAVEPIAPAAATAQSEPVPVVAVEAMPTPAPPPPPPPPPPAPEPPASPTGLTPSSEPRLLVLRGLKRNVEYPIYEGQNFIGRADEKPVDIDLEEQEPPERIWCSRQHACISWENGELFIEDLNSSNGTYVNRTKVYPGQKRRLNLNDVIQIGNVQLKVIA